MISAYVSLVGKSEEKRPSRKYDDVDLSVVASVFEERLTCLNREDKYVPLKRSRTTFLKPFCHNTFIISAQFKKNSYKVRPIKLYVLVCVCCLFNFGWLSPVNFFIV